MQLCERSVFISVHQKSQSIGQITGRQVDHGKIHIHKSCKQSEIIKSAKQMKSKANMKLGKYKEIQK